jgi:hypothetical protein
MVTRTEIRETALILGAIVGQVSQSMLPFGIQNHRLVRDVLDEMEEEGTLEPAYTGSYHYHLTSEPAEVLVDFISLTDLRLFSTNYGPSETDGLWKLYLITSAGQLALNVDDTAAHDLWSEIKDVPHLSVGPSGSDQIRGTVLDKILSAEDPLLRHLDSILSGEESPLRLLHLRLESALQSEEIDWETYCEYAKMMDCLENLFARN